MVLSNLDIAVRNRDYNGVVRVLNDDGSVIMHAVYVGNNLKIIKLLVKAGVDLKYRNEWEFNC